MSCQRKGTSAKRILLIGHMDTVFEADGPFQKFTRDDVQFQKVMSYIDSGKREGAELLAGGNRVGDKGNFIEPTVFAEVKDEMKIAREEIFGPVMSIMKFRDLDEVIARANNTTYGLAAAVWTRDIGKALAISNKCQGGHDLGELLRRFRCRSALRRLQAVGDWAGNGRVRSPAVHGSKDSHYQDLNVVSGRAFVEMGRIARRKYIRSVVSVILFCVGTGTPVLAQATQVYPFTGTWKMNVEKSKFRPGPAPRSVTATIGTDGRVSFQGIGPDGKPTGRSHPSSVGKEVLFDGTKNLTIETRAQGNVLDDTIRLDGKPIETVHAVFSSHGRTVTLNREGSDPQGHPVHNLEILEKQ
jgi:hypothetical protein